VKTKDFSEYLCTGDYSRHLTSSIIGTADVIYEVLCKRGPYDAGGEGKENLKKKQKKKKKERSSP